MAAPAGDSRPFVIIPSMPRDPLVLLALELGWISADQATRFEDAPLETLVQDGALTREQAQALRRRAAETRPAGEAPTEPLPGRLGKYELLERIACGGMAEVWRARDTDLDRRVALKVVRSPDERARRRLLREAETAARLDHPGIVPIYDASESGDAAYVAMRYIEGPTLDAAPLDLRGRVAALRDAARALHYAHGRGVVHRDIKPKNILLENGRAIVTDFGMAKRYEVDTSLSVTGAVIGTAAYMPPEQADGRSDAGNARSDVYSLGATLYELSTGRPPFVGDSFVSVLLQVLHDPPPSPRRLNPRLPADLEAVILRAIEKEPGQRYSSAEELAADLDRWLAGEPVAARRNRWRGLVALLGRRRKALAAAAGAASVLAAAAWIGSGAIRALEEAAAIERIRSPLNVFKPGPGTEKILDSAILDFDEAVRRFPASPRARWYRGIWRMLRGEFRVAARLDPSEDVAAALEDFAWVREHGGVPLEGILFHEGLTLGWQAQWILAKVRLSEASQEDLKTAVEAALGRFSSMRTVKARLQWADHLRMGQLHLAISEGAVRAGERSRSQEALTLAREHLAQASAEGEPGIWRVELLLTLARERILTAMLEANHSATAEAEHLLRQADSDIPQEKAERLLLRAQAALLRGNRESSRDLAKAAFLLFPAWEAEWPELR